MKLSERVMKEDNFTKKEWLSIFESDRIDTLELLHEAYIVRKHYYGKKVKLNMILNAKSGICTEDCGYCGQSREMKQKQRYGLVDKVFISSFNLNSLKKIREIEVKMY